MYYIATEIEGVRHYVRRNRINKHGFISITMLTTAITKAKVFLHEYTLPMGYYKSLKPQS